jgi:membrane glycosyltransferase
VLISRSDQRRSFYGSMRVFGGIVCETLLAALVAPSMMILQSSAVAEILLGRDAGWQVQRRSGGEIARGEIYRKLATPTLWGVLMGLSAYAVSIPLLLWMSPVIAGLLLAVPLGLLTSRRSGRAMLFATPEDYRPPPVVNRANDLAASARFEVTGALLQLGEDAELLTCHLASLPNGTQNKFGRIDVPLATARAKIERCELFDDVVRWLDKSEIRAVLNDAPTLQCVLELRRPVSAV